MLYYVYILFISLCGLSLFLNINIVYIDFELCCRFNLLLCFMHDAAELFKPHSPLIGEASIQFANGDEGKRRHAVYSRFLNAAAIKTYYDVYNKVSKSNVISLKKFTWCCLLTSLVHKVHAIVSSAARVNNLMMALITALHQSLFHKVDKHVFFVIICT